MESGTYNNKLMRKREKKKEENVNIIDDIMQWEKNN